MKKSEQYDKLICSLSTTDFALFYAEVMSEEAMAEDLRELDAYPNELLKQLQEFIKNNEKQRGDKPND